MEKACWKRPISDQQLEAVIAAVESEIEANFESEVESRHVGELVMQHLRALDEVAYVRFASVYRQFKDVQDFVEELRPMLEESRAVRSSVDCRRVAREARHIPLAGSQSSLSTAQQSLLLDVPVALHSAMFGLDAIARGLAGWLSAASVLMFVGSISPIPWLVIRIPADYFLRQRHYADRWKPRHPLLRIVFLATKNLIGGLLVLAGVVMLVTPGQGILTILVGLLFLDFPGKFALERWLIERPPVFRMANWMRAKAGRPALELPEIHDAVGGEENQGGRQSQ